MVLVLQFALSKFFTLKYPVSTDDLAPSSFGIKLNFIVVTYLSGSFLDIIEIRRYDHFLKDRLIVIILIT